MIAGPFVVDTNVVVAGLITREPGATTALFLDRMLRGELRFLLSEALLAEYRRVLLRPKIATAHGLAVDEVDEVLIRLASHGAVRELSETQIRTPDPVGDEHLFALLAVDAKALLVSGDAAVLRQAGVRGRTLRAALAETGEA